MKSVIPPRRKSGFAITLGEFLGSKGTDGFDPAALKYLWPGSITQSIDQAYYGQYMNSPEGKQYKIGTFSFDPDLVTRQPSPIRW
ncbi:MAG: hypothetical protein M3Y72_27295 [Acidobacteriota bacterium]|nr:hypothetical protein [Acidobacteriota bacterium]